MIWFALIASCFLGVIIGCIVGADYSQSRRCNESAVAITKQYSVRDLIKNADKKKR